MKLFLTAVAGVCLMASSGMSSVMAKDVSEEMRDVSAFSSIRNKGSFDVRVSVGDAQSVKVIADSDVMDKIETEVRGGTLHIEFESERSWNWSRNIDVLRLDITVPTLEAAMVYGSGNFVINGVNGGDFEADINGSGDISLIDATIEDLSISIKGSGDVEASGSCEKLDIEVKGSGDVDARSMECDSGDIGVMGSGDVSAYVKNSIDVGIMGSGDVVVWGKPEKVSSRSMGSGEVVIR